MPLSRSPQDQQPAQGQSFAAADFPGEYPEFVAALPEAVRRVSDGDLLFLWQRAQENARRAKALETQGEVLAKIYERVCDDLRVQGLTFEDLMAYEREGRGALAFPRDPDYLLPHSERRNQ